MGAKVGRRAAFISQPLPWWLLECPCDRAGCVPGSRERHRVPATEAVLSSRSLL